MIKVKRLIIGDDKNDVRFLGYKLKVSECEYKLLFALGMSQRKSIESLSAVLAKPPEKRGNVAVHICSINRKAEIIGGRKLVLCENSEYYFNEHM